MPDAARGATGPRIEKYTGVMLPVPCAACGAELMRPEWMVQKAREGHKKYQRFFCDDRCSNRHWRGRRKRPPQRKTSTARGQPGIKFCTDDRVRDLALRISSDLAPDSRDLRMMDRAIEAGYSAMDWLLVRWPALAAMRGELHEADVIQAVCRAVYGQRAEVD